MKKQEKKLFISSIRFRMLLRINREKQTNKSYKFYQNGQQDKKFGDGYTK